MILRIGGGGIESTINALDWAIEKAPIHHMDKLVDVKLIIENLLVEKKLIGRRELDVFQDNKAGR